MIRIGIPSREPVFAEHLVLDYNGTLALDGQLLEGVSELLGRLSQHLSVHVITADTFGTVEKTFTNTNISVKIIDGKDQGTQKADFVANLKPQSVVAIGNGANDAQMLKLAAIGIATMQAEGASVKALINAEITCTSIVDALNLLLNPKRIAATLRL
ncbi:MAG: HAD hydrolase family protein [Tenuifilaceae bacterium]|jgi:P-type E1-E2 ATPase|nr:HAD hydrolase family protein [Tenuifilaceae bacterium]